MLRYYRKKGIALLLTVCFLLAMVAPGLAQGAENTGNSLQDALDGIVGYYANNKTKLDSWREVVALKEAGQDVFKWTLPDWKIEQLNEDSQPTDYAGTILGMLAAGQDPKKVAVNDQVYRNLVAELASLQNDDGSFGTWFNQTVWAVIALDKAGGEYDSAKAIEFILSQQKSDGGFALFGDAADPDVTGDALLALAPHKTVDGISDAIDRAIECLKRLQLPDGGFASWGSENPESIAAVIRGLLACGEDILSEDWIKEEGTMIDALFSFQLADGSFVHSRSETECNATATEQALQAVADMVNAGIDYIVKTGQRHTGERTEATVRVRVEGATSSLADETVTVTGSALDALKAAVGENNVVAPGGFITGILGESGKTISEGILTSWMYYVIRDGAIEPGAFSQGAGSYNVRDGDEVVFYIGAMDSTTWMAKTFIPQVEITPAFPKAGENFTIKIKALNFDWTSGLVELTPQELQEIGEFTVTVGDKEYRTQDGQVVIPAIKAGTLSFTVSNSNEAGYPDVVTYKGSIEIGASGGSGSTIQKISVQLAIVGRNGELIFGPSTVNISKDSPHGYTPLGALDASGVDYNLSAKFEGFVEAICGQANEGMSGWLFVVNNTVPSVGADQYTLKDGDRIIWYYSKDINEPPPKWDDLVKQAASGTISASTATQQVADILSDLQRGKVVAGQAIAGINEVLGKLKETEVTKELQDKLEEAVKTLSQWVVNLPDKALSVRTDGETASVKIDGDAVKDQVSTIKNAAALAEKLEKFGVTGTASLVTDKIVVELPADLAGKNAFTVDLPADAAQEVAAGNLKFTVKGGVVFLDLPPEALKTVIAAAPNVSQVEVSVEKLDESKVSVFKEASVIGNKALNLEINAVTPEGKRASPQAVFTKKITVTFSLDGVDLSRVDKSKLSVYRQKQDGSWEFVGGRLSPDEKSFSFETDHLSLYALLEFKNKFKDIKDHWARETIELMAMRLIARGISEDSFAPDQKLSRAQFAAFLVRALNVEEETPQVRTFSDVPPDHWGYRAIEAAFREGLVAGTGAGRFEPERAIKREEMAAILAAVLKRNGIATTLTDTERDEVLKGYGDSDRISEWAKEGLAVCVSKGIIKGRAEAALVPLGSATRAEAVVVLENLLRLLGKL